MAAFSALEGVHPTPKPVSLEEKDASVSRATSSVSQVDETTVIGAGLTIPPVQAAQPSSTNAQSANSERASAQNETVTEEIASLLRVQEWLSSRLKDDPNHPNAELWATELEACNSELSLCGPTLLLIPQSSVKLTPRLHTSPINRIKKELLPPASPPSTSATSQQGDLFESILTLWAAVRKEPIDHNEEELNKSRQVLNETLDKIQLLAQNVQEGDVPDARYRSATLAMVSLLEENVRLRLRIVMMPPVQSPKLSTRHGSGSYQEMLVANDPAAMTNSPSIKVVDEECEI